MFKLIACFKELNEIGFMATVLFAAMSLLCSPAVAAPLFQQPEDVVFIRKPGGEKTIKRSGEIVQWKGGSLTIHSNGSDREVDNDEIVKLQTTWNKAYRSGLTEMGNGRTRIAIQHFQEALKSERRPWAARIIRSKLIVAFQSIGQPGDAVNQFLTIVDEDSQTRFLNIAPLPWTGSGSELVQQAEKWAEASDPTIKLVGASWMLAGPKREQAVKLLERLSRDIDPRVQSIAIAQLWRSRTNVNAKQTEVWQGLIEKMPRDFRAGPFYVLANAQANCQKIDESLINLMRITILYPEQRTLSAAALYRSAGLLQNKGQKQKANSILNELVTQHPETIWAQQVNQ